MVCERKVCGDSLSQRLYMQGYECHKDDEESDEVADCLDWIGVDEDAHQWVPATHRTAHQGCYVFAFQRGNDSEKLPDRMAPGSVDTKGKAKDVKDPMKEMRKIFTHPRATDHVSTFNDGFPEFLESDGYEPKESVSTELYHDTIRKKLLRILSCSGIQLSHRESCDKDEVFVKVWIDHDGEVIKSMAKSYRWVMPFKETAYEDFHSGDTHGMPPTNNSFDQGEPEKVVAHTEYQEGHAHLLQPFRRSDERKLLHIFMAEWMDLQQMQMQGVISNHFLRTSVRETAGLDDEWGSFAKVWNLPDDDNLDNVREHFGDQIAFFYGWLNNFIRGFALLAVAAFIVWVSREYYHAQGLVVPQRVLQGIFCVVLFLWTPWMFGLFRDTNKRKCQKWDSDGPGFTLIQIPNANHVPNKRARWRRIGFVVSACCTVGYMMFALALISYFRWMVSQKSELDSFWNNQSSRLTTLLILVLNLTWGYIVVPLTELENHRLESQRQSWLVVKLAIVKIVLALYPLVYIGFLQKYTVMWCAETFEELSQKLYNRHSFTVNNTVMAHVLSKFPHVPPEFSKGQVCIGGCYPMLSCPSQFEKFIQIFTGHEMLKCTTEGVLSTNCVADVGSYLGTYFFTYVVLDLVFLAWPRILVWIQIKTEIAKNRRTAWSLLGKMDLPPIRDLFGCESLNDQTNKPAYTYTEMQAKHPLYSYNEWGGSNMDDFLEFSIMFAIVISFGIVMPLVFVFAFMAFMVMYRLMAFRMVYLTQRPFPVGARDIGMWASVFDTILILSVMTNTAMACFVMYPGRMLHWRHGLLIFIVLEHLFLVAMAFVMTLHPEVPIDVEEISRKNQEFLVRHEQNHLNKDRDRYEEKSFDWYDISHLDIGVFPKKPASSPQRR